MDAQSSQDLAATKEKILSKYPTVVPQGWGLNIRSLRSTSSLDGKPVQDTQHILRASHLNEETFLAIDSGHSFSTISVSSEDGDAFVKLLTERFNTLWTTRMLLAIGNGVAYELDGVTIRLGELRVPGQTQTVRGVLCFVASSLPQQKIARSVVTSVAETLGFVDSRKHYGSWASKDKSAEVRLWCEALSQRP